jgi:hypothetical protein
MTDDEAKKKFWFPAKRYGWGWGLAHCWQGLLVQIGYVVLSVASAKLLLPRGHKNLFWISFLIATVLFLAIHCIKGEKPVAWRWIK